MTDPLPPDDLSPSNQDDLVAAEYVLGTLPEPERRAARDRIAADGAFAARVAAWEGRLSPLNEGYTDAPAPDLLPRIEAQLFGAATGAPAAATAGRRTVTRWRIGLFSGLGAAVLALAVIVFWTPPQPGVLLQADLAAEQGDLRFAARWDSTAGALELTRVAGTAAPAGQDYELWLIGEDGVPQSLGLLQEQVTELDLAVTPGVTLAISLEPAGGSPDAGPTGPVLAAAPLL